jgi:hypothetical protein
MAIKYLTNIDLGTNEIQYPVLHPLTSPPTAYTAREGQLYYNSVDDKVKVYNGSAWVTVGGVNSITSGNTDTITIGGTQSDPTISANTGGISATESTLVTGATIYNYIIGLDLVYSVNGSTSTFITVTNTGTDTNPIITAALSASGTPDSTKYLRGDNTWSPITGIYNWNLGAGTATTETILNSDTVNVIGTANEIETTLSGKDIIVGLPSDVSITNNLTVGGNLTVNGTVTTVNTETINLADNIILLNSNAAGAATESAGIEVERGSDANKSLIWNEANNRWELQANDGNYYDISHGSYATSIGGATSITVTHNLNSRDVDVQLYDNATYETVIADVVRTTVNTITVYFNTAPSNNSIRVLIKKIG